MAATRSSSMPVQRAPEYDKHNTISDTSKRCEREKRLSDLSRKNSIPSRKKYELTQKQANQLSKQSRQLLTAAEGNNFLFAARGLADLCLDPAIRQHIRDDDALMKDLVDKFRDIKTNEAKATMAWVFARLCNEGEDVESAGRAGQFGIVSVVLSLMADRSTHLDGNLQISISALVVSVCTYHPNHREMIDGGMIDLLLVHMGKAVEIQAQIAIARALLAFTENTLDKILAAADTVMAVLSRMIGVHHRRVQEMALRLLVHFQDHHELRETLLSNGLLLPVLKIYEEHRSYTAERRMVDPDADPVESGAPPEDSVRTTDTDPAAKEEGGDVSASNVTNDLVRTKNARDGLSTGAVTPTESSGPREVLVHPPDEDIAQKSVLCALTLLAIRKFLLGKNPTHAVQIMLNRGTPKSFVVHLGRLHRGITDLIHPGDVDPTSTTLQVADALRGEILTGRQEGSSTAATSPRTLPRTETPSRTPSLPPSVAHSRRASMHSPGGSGTVVVAVSGPGVVGTLAMLIALLSGYRDDVTVQLTQAGAVRVLCGVYEDAVEETATRHACLVGLCGLLRRQRSELATAVEAGVAPIVIAAAENNSSEMLPVVAALLDVLCQHYRATEGPQPSKGPVEGAGTMEVFGEELTMRVVEKLTEWHGTHVVKQHLLSAVSCLAQVQETRKILSSKRIAIALIVYMQDLAIEDKLLPILLDVLCDLVRTDESELLEIAGSSVLIFLFQLLERLLHPTATCADEVSLGRTMKSVCDLIHAFARCDKARKEVLANYIKIRPDGTVICPTKPVKRYRIARSVRPQGSEATLVKTPTSHKQSRARPRIRNPRSFSFAVNAFMSASLLRSASSRTMDASGRDSDGDNEAGGDESAKKRNTIRDILMRRGLPSNRDSLSPHTPHTPHTPHSPKSPPSPHSPPFTSAINTSEDASADTLPKSGLERTASDYMVYADEAHSSPSLHGLSSSIPGSPHASGGRLFSAGLDAPDSPLPTLSEHGPMDPVDGEEETGSEGLNPGIGDRSSTEVPAMDEIGNKGLTTTVTAAAANRRRARPSRAYLSESAVADDGGSQSNEAVTDDGAPNSRTASQDAGDTIGSNNKGDERKSGGGDDGRDNDDTNNDGNDGGDGISGHSSEGHPGVGGTGNADGATNDDCGSNSDDNADGGGSAYQTPPRSRSRRNIGRLSQKPQTFHVSPSPSMLPEHAEDSSPDDGDSDGSSSGSDDVGGGGATADERGDNDASRSRDHTGEGDVAHGDHAASKPKKSNDSENTGNNKRVFRRKTRAKFSDFTKLNRMSLTVDPAEADGADNSITGDADFQLTLTPISEFSLQIDEGEDETEAQKKYCFHLLCDVFMHSSLEDVRQAAINCLASLSNQRSPLLPADVSPTIPEHEQMFLQSFAADCDWHLQQGAVMLVGSIACTEREDAYQLARMPRILLGLCGLLQRPKSVQVEVTTACTLAQIIPRVIEDVDKAVLDEVLQAVIMRIGASQTQQAVMYLLLLVERMAAMKRFRSLLVKHGVLSVFTTKLRILRYGHLLLVRTIHFLLENKLDLLDQKVSSMMLMSTLLEVMDTSEDEELLYQIARTLSNLVVRPEFRMTMKRARAHEVLTGALTFCLAESQSLVPRLLDGIGADVTQGLRARQGQRTDASHGQGHLQQISHSYPGPSPHSSPTSKEPQSPALRPHKGIHPSPIHGRRRPRSTSTGSKDGGGRRGTVLFSQPFSENEMKKLRPVLVAEEAVLTCVANLLYLSPAEKRADMTKTYIQSVSMLADGFQSAGIVKRISAILAAAQSLPVSLMFAATTVLVRLTETSALTRVAVLDDEQLLRAFCRCFEGTLPTSIQLSVARTILRLAQDAAGKEMHMINSGVGDILVQKLAEDSDLELSITLINSIFRLCVRNVYAVEWFGSSDVCRILTKLFVEKTDLNILLSICDCLRILSRSQSNKERLCELGLSCISLDRLRQFFGFDAILTSKMHIPHPSPSAAKEASSIHSARSLASKAGSHSSTMSKTPPLSARAQLTAEKTVDVWGQGHQGPQPYTPLPGSDGVNKPVLSAAISIWGPGGGTTKASADRQHGTAEETKEKTASEKVEALENVVSSWVSTGSAVATGATNQLPADDGGVSTGGGAAAAAVQAFSQQHAISESSTTRGPSRDSVAEAIADEATHPERANVVTDIFKALVSQSRPQSTSNSRENSRSNSPRMLRTPLAEEARPSVSSDDPSAHVLSDNDSDPLSSLVQRLHETAKLAEENMERDNGPDSQATNSFPITAVSDDNVRTERQPDGTCAEGPEPLSIQVPVFEVTSPQPSPPPHSKSNRGFFPPSNTNSTEVTAHSDTQHMSKSYVTANQTAATNETGKHTSHPNSGPLSVEDDAENVESPVDGPQRNRLRALQDGKDNNSQRPSPTHNSSNPAAAAKGTSACTQSAANTAAKAAAGKGSSGEGAPPNVSDERRSSLVVFKRNVRLIAAAANVTKPPTQNFRKALLGLIWNLSVAPINRLALSSSGAIPLILSLLVTSTETAGHQVLPQSQAPAEAPADIAGRGSKAAGVGVDGTATHGSGKVGGCIGGGGGGGSNNDNG
eukprot:Rmarinus@m.5894